MDLLPHDGPLHPLENGPSTVNLSAFPSSSRNVHTPCHTRFRVSVPSDTGQSSCPEGRGRGEERRGPTGEWEFGHGHTETSKRRFGIVGDVRSVRVRGILRTTTGPSVHNDSKGKVSTPLTVGFGSPVNGSRCADPSKWWSRLRSRTSGKGVGRVRRRSVDERG